mgnify:CR=1 FL=1
MNWDDKAIVGNYYSTKYSDAWDVIEKTLPLLPALENKTIEFVNLIANSNYPREIKEAALFNSSTLRSQTTFRDKNGNFFGWEGVFAAYWFLSWQLHACMELRICFSILVWEPGDEHAPD